MCQWLIEKLQLIVKRYLMMRIKLEYSWSAEIMSIKLKTNLPFTMAKLIIKNKEFQKLYKKAHFLIIQNARDQNLLEIRKKKNG